jgi:RNA polymerase sigma-70 factor (ECF subfamily)
VAAVVQSTTDFELLERWGEGDRESGAKLFERYFGALFRFFENKAQDSIEDLVQQTLLACVEGRARFRRESSFRTYLFQTARFQLYAHYRSRNRRRSRELDFELTSVADLGTSPSGVIARKQDERLLLEALRRIPLEHQVLLELYLWEDLSASEIAEILEVTEYHVRSRLQLAHDGLRKQLAAMTGESCKLMDTVDDLQAWAKRTRGMIDE